MAEKPILQVLDKVQDDFFNHLLDYTTDGCVLLDRDKKIVFWMKT